MRGHRRGCYGGSGTFTCDVIRLTAYSWHGATGFGSTLVEGGRRDGHRAHERETPALVLVFRQTLEDERRAQETYTEATGITEDEALVEVFRTLLEDEVRHERELFTRYEKFKTKLGA
jgi:hypothetical protein